MTMKAMHDFIVFTDRLMSMGPLSFGTRQTLKEDHI